MTSLSDRPPLTAEQFCQAQKLLGLNNREMAHALEIRGKGAVTLISLYRLGKRKLPLRASQLIRIWLHEGVPPELKPKPIPLIRKY